uniref:Reverse transcriptase domain-containing protein n=1 Tax=Caenorhabditis japonica TaxID=281687 RepID=A0A8R1ECZ4_CAEJA
MVMDIDDFQKKPAYIALLQQCYTNFSNDNYNHLPGIRINGQNLTLLRFADDIVLVTNSPRMATRMIQQLFEMCGKVGLRMNTNKTKVMRNKFASQSPVNVTHNKAITCIEEVNEYVYLGRLLNQTGSSRNSLLKTQKSEFLARKKWNRLFDSTLHYRKY